MPIKPQHIEHRLAWWNEVSAGIGLALGYVIFGMYWLLVPPTVLEVESQKVELTKKVIGFIPSSVTDSLDGQIHTGGSQPVIELAPKRDSNGNLITYIHKQKYSGWGTPKVIAERVEILEPTLGSPSFRVIWSTLDGKPHTIEPKDTPKQRDINPNIILVGSGHFLTKKSVSFDDNISADLFALRLGALFAFLSLVLFTIKSRDKVKSFLLKLLTTPMPQEEDDEAPPSNTQDKTPK
jgi:hypothetical protein